MPPIVIVARLRQDDQVGELVMPPGIDAGDPREPDPVV